MAGQEDVNRQRWKVEEIEEFGHIWTFRWKVHERAFQITNLCLQPCLVWNNEIGGIAFSASKMVMKENVDLFIIDAARAFNGGYFV